MANTNYKSLTPAGIDFYRIDDAQMFPIGMRATGVDVSNSFGYGEFVYLAGAADVAEGSCVTYDEAGAVTLLAANAKGPCAWALGACVANKYGWYQRRGKIYALAAVSCADNAQVGYETTAGSVGDGRAAGDQIYGVITRSSTDGATTNLWLQAFADPFVDDGNGG